LEALKVARAYKELWKGFHRRNRYIYKRKISPTRRIDGKIVDGSRMRHNDVYNKRNNNNDDDDDDDNTRTVE